ncbi:MAG: hypothetical protein ABIO33_06070 [Leifsonia sp.]
MVEPRREQPQESYLVPARVSAAVAQRDPAARQIDVIAASDTGI